MTEKVMREKDFIQKDITQKDITQKDITQKMNWLKDCYIAHRGYHNPKDAPENSMAAFANALKEGFAIELDIHLTKDRQVVVFHDRNLKRMTGSSRNIADCTWDEIRTLRLLDTKEKIPLLREVLDYVDGRVPLLIEIKNRRRVRLLERKTDQLLRQYHGQFAVQSFNPYSLGWFKDHSPKVLRGQISGAFKTKELSLYKKFILNHLLLNYVSRPHFINYDINYLSRLPSRIQKKKGIILGHTARNPEDYTRAMEKITNVVFEGFNPKEL